MIQKYTIALLCSYFACVLVSLIRSVTFIIVATIARRMDCSVVLISHNYN